MTGLEYVAENKWENGKIYVPRSGKTYSVSVHLQDINTLIVRGFFGIELFGESLTFYKKSKATLFAIYNLFTFCTTFNALPSVIVTV
jgi:hypothetical protein